MKSVYKMKTLEQQRSKYAYVFLIPLIFGLIFLFGIPIVRSAWFSLSQVKVSVTGFNVSFNGISNFYDALFVSTTYREAVVNSLLNTLLNLPLITVFSCFVARILNQKFHGRGLVRVIFFLPIVLASSSLIAFDSGDAIQGMMSSQGGISQSVTGLAINSEKLGTWLIESNILPTQITNYLLSAADRIYEIVVLSGVQILIFLSALQAIPETMYEVASIEGASAWEKYWKVTFPMITPMILISMVYTVVDSFTSSTNKTLTLINETAFTNTNFGLAASMSWIYTIIMLLFLGIIYLIMNRIIKSFE